MSFAPLAFKLFYAARHNAVLRRSSFPPVLSLYRLRYLASRSFAFVAYPPFPKNWRRSAAALAAACAAERSAALATLCAAELRRISCSASLHKINVITHEKETIQGRSKTIARNTFALLRARLPSHPAAAGSF